MRGTSEGTGQVALACTLPIKSIDEKKQKIFIDIVQKILTFTRENDYLTNPGSQIKVTEYEKQIDQMVYELMNKIILSFTEASRCLSDLLE